MQIKVGVHNWKNLFKKPSLNDWITLFMIAMMLVAAYAYQHDVGVCHETLRNLDEDCTQYKFSGNFSNQPFFGEGDYVVINNTGNLSVNMTINYNG